MSIPAIFYQIFLILIIFFDTSTVFAKDVLRLGVLAEADEEKNFVYALHKPIVDLLNAESSDVDIQMEVLNMQELDSRIEDGGIDIVISSPLYYGLLSNKYNGLKALATRIKSVNGISTPLVGGVIFTRSDRQDINSLKDISNRTIAVRGRHLWGCFAIPAYELLHAGVEITYKVRPTLLELNTVDAVIQAVMEKKADVGMMRTDILETLFANGRLKPEEIKVINKQKTQVFPFITSTSLYPEWLIFAMPHVSQDLCNSLARALFAIKPFVPSTGTSISGFVLPFSYVAVEHVLSELEFPGFGMFERFWRDLIYSNDVQKYIVLGGLFLIMVMLLVLGLVLSSVNQEKHRMKSMLNSIPYPALLVNRLHKIIAVNNAAKELFQAQEGKYCWEQLWQGEFLPEEQKKQYEISGPTSDMRCNFCKAQDILTTGTPRSVELFINGHYWDSWWVPIDSYQFLHYFIDITQHKEKERRLEETQRFLQEIANTVQDMIWVKDVHKCYLFANKAICEKLLCATDINEPLGKTDLYFAKRIRAERPDDKTWHTFGELCQNSDDVVILTGKPGRFEEYGNVRGKYLCLDVIKVPLFDKNGQATAVVGSARDITYDKELQREKELLEYKLRQSAKMEAIGIMTGGVAHNFNNLLQVILGYAQILAQKIPQKNDDIHLALDRIISSCERGIILIKNMMATSRKNNSEHVFLNINDEIITIKEIIIDSLRKNIKIEVDLEQGLWTVNAIPNSISIILLNMVNNAQDAMPNGGVLRIRTRNISILEKSNDSTIPLKAGDYVLLEISDTGCGMSEEVLQHIFEPFFTTKDVNKGTGLGLYTVYDIVKNLNGEIYCHSQVGKGTTFTIYLPVASKESIKSVTEDTSDNSCNLRPDEKINTVLVVDDEEAIRSLIKQVMESVGYNVLEAENGDRALEIYKTRPNEIHLVILDLNMPGMSGHECLHELLSINPNVPVLVASGYSEHGMEETVLSNGAKGFIQKPFKLTELLQKLQCMLN